MKELNFPSVMAGDLCRLILINEFEQWVGALFAPHFQFEYGVEPCRHPSIRLPIVHPSPVFS